MKDKTEQLDRPAPEADAAERMAYAGEYMVPTEFARRLERERDEIKEKYRFAVIHWQIGAAKMERERDEARDQAQRLRVQLNHYTQANEMAEQAFRERDEAHKIAERAIDDLAWFNEINAQILREQLEQIKEETK